MNSFDYKKTVQAVNYLINKTGNKKIDYLKVIKLIYIADRYCVRKYGSLITFDKYVAMNYGPVPSYTKDILNGKFSGELEQYYANEFFTKNGNDILSIKEVDDNFFSEVDKESLDFAFDNFGSNDGFLLAEITHEYPEWKKFENKIKSNKDVFPMSYNDFFKDPESLTKNKKDPFEMDKETLDSSKGMFEENFSFITALA